MATYRVRSWDQLGDSVILTGAVRNVRAAHPECLFRYDGWDKYKPIYANNEDFAEFHGGEYLHSIGYGDGHAERHGLFGNHVEAQTQRLCEFMGYDETVPIVTDVPVLYLTEEEKAWGEQFAGKWIVNANCQKESISKAYPYWQDVIDGMRDLGLECVQIGGNLPQDISTELKGVEDWRGRTSIRELISMAYNCAGIVSPSSGIVHIGAAWRKPTVCLIGARENKLTLYDHCKYITTECEDQYCIARTAKDCKHWIGRCPCMDFSPKLVLIAIKGYIGL